MPTVTKVQPTERAILDQVAILIHERNAAREQCKRLQAELYQARTVAMAAETAEQAARDTAAALRVERDRAREAEAFWREHATLLQKVNRSFGA